MRLQLEEAEVLPCGSEALVDIEVAVLDIVGRSLDLDVAAGAERNFLSSGSCTLSSLMNVATFLLEMTVHSHFLTPNTLSGTRMSMSPLTLTWHASLMPALSCFLLRCEYSTGSGSPPPESTVHLHCPQLPFPPHADGMKICFAARVLSSLPPAGTVTVLSGSPLIFIVTSPVLTSLALAMRMQATSTTMMATNIRTPRNTVSISCAP